MAFAPHEGAMQPSAGASSATSNDRGLIVYRTSRATWPLTREGGLWFSSGAAIDPLGQGHRLVLVQPLQQGRHLVGDHGQLAVLLAQEPLRHQAVQEGEQRLEEAPRVEQADRLAMQPELTPGPDLQQ